VRLIEMEEGDRVVSVARLAEREAEEAAGGVENGDGPEPGPGESIEPDVPEEPGE
jgi:hypothetical protein